MITIYQPISRDEELVVTIRHRSENGIDSDPRIQVRAATHAEICLGMRELNKRLQNGILTKTTLDGHEAPENAVRPGLAGGLETSKTEVAVSTADRVPFENDRPFAETDEKGQIFEEDKFTEANLKSLWCFPEIRPGLRFESTPSAGNEGLDDYKALMESAMQQSMSHHHRLERRKILARVAYEIFMQAIVMALIVLVITFDLLRLGGYVFSGAAIVLGYAACQAIENHPPRFLRPASL